jgi:hypothetical protein
MIRSPSVRGVEGEGGDRVEGEGGRGGELQTYRRYDERKGGAKAGLKRSLPNICMRTLLRHTVSNLNSNLKIKFESRP